MSTACVKPLQERFPYARLSMVVDESIQPLLLGHPVLQIVGLVLTSKERSSEALDALFSQGSRALLVELNSHPWVAEAAVKYPRLERRRYKQGFLDFGSSINDRRRFGLVHEARACWDLLNEFDVNEPEVLRAFLPKYAFAWPSLVERYPLLRDEKFAAFHLSAYGGKKSWPIACFVEVASILASSGWLPVIVGADSSLSQAFASAYRGPLLDLTGETSLPELGALLGHAQLMLSRDSGPAHLAAAVGCPTVTLMSSHPKHCARRWAPLGDRVAVVEQPLVRKKCLESRDDWWARVFSMIRTENVLDAITRVTGNQLLPLN